MEVNGLEALTKIADSLEKKWNAEIKEQIDSGLSRIYIFHEEEIDAAVYKELQMRYKKAGFKIQYQHGAYNFKIMPGEE